jgi:uncharacterized coiled-coil protein SlyX
MRTKELEVQYNMARYERERKAAEQEMARSRALNAQVLTFSKTEAELRSQLNIYVDKFKQVRRSTYDIYRSSLIVNNPHFFLGISNVFRATLSSSFDPILQYQANKCEGRGHAQQQ